MKLGLLVAGLSAGLTCSNFLYQLAIGGSFIVAGERSLFQAFALLVFWGLLLIWPEDEVALGDVGTKRWSFRYKWTRNKE